METKEQPAGAATAAPVTLEKIHQHPPFIDLGKVKKKNAKRLKKGTGKLMDEVTTSYQHIQDDLGGTPTPLIISYEAKPRKKRKKKNKIKLMGLKIDRKKLKKRMKKGGIRANFL